MVTKALKILAGTAEERINMNKKEVLASIIELANELDSVGAFKDADTLTNVGERLANWDDDFGGDFDYSDSDRLSDLEGIDDYNRYEERQLDLDRWHEQNEENGGSYADEDDAMSAIRRNQAEYGNEPYVMLIDYDGEDDRGTSYDIMPLSKYEENGHWMQLYKDIPAGTPEELAPYARDFETETPLGMELDGGSDIDFDY